MSLIAVKQHLSQVRLASLSSLCLIYQIDAETMRCMLRHLIQKGCVRQCSKKSACGSKCFKCPSETTELYEWVA